MGLDQAVVFPNFGLLWERRLSKWPAALKANMGAWNRWCAAVSDRGWWTSPSGGSSHVARPGMAGDATGGVVGGRGAAGHDRASGRRRTSTSHPDHDSIWAAFVHHGITPVFHVADQPRVFDDAFYTDSDESIVSVLESVFLWAPPAIAVTDLIVNGTLARHPDLRIGIIELSSVWVPQYLMMLDGGWDFTTKLNGAPLAALDSRPSEYFRRQVRVSSFSYEQPARLAAKSADLFMCCSDFPHSEGTATPMDDYGRAGSSPESDTGLFHDNVSDLLSR